ncbi:dihydrolipoamide acetyltransferase family protein [Thermoflavimicrobium dichotomicum]|uniref:Dihydrolipoamide acetyltransferase component of pyruvate dehydrogenase complex n=1 Tax=Thermoflavimicrobium dichotomicum TaxID=46223 RepID=A0A1I3V257_9BACL|nr:dihydrolipoamide acetyltransferase family protein [Thermoflavimicrobium dichotomicum]SFJ89518.1 pyruvate dehydrogenase E2 component (dihydrolipoamide acetyltransferase) [Thermoflavimicrobium dichotomicum]
MAIDFKLPDIGEGVAEAEIVRWLVSAGDQVEQDQPVCEVQTDKAVVELPAPQAGRIARLYWKEGETVPVGSVLFTLQSKDEVSKDIFQTSDSSTHAEHSLSNRKTDTDSSKRRKRVLATPSTRRLAREWGIDLSEVEGTGPNGRILNEDVQRSVEQIRQVKESVETVRVASLSVFEHGVDDKVKEESLSPVRRVIAERLHFSVTHKPHATHFDELVVEGLVRWRLQRLQERTEEAPRLTYLPVLLKMVAVTLKHHPQFNAHFDEEKQVVHTFSSISLGIATDTPRGLLVPVIHQVEKKSIEQLASEVGQLTELARLGRLSSEQLKGSTFTISNAGALGGKWATPIINPPEVAILAIHPIERKPVVSPNGEIVPGWRMNVSLSFDHRVLDGADAIRFTQTLERYTADPGRLVSELI